MYGHAMPNPFVPQRQPMNPFLMQKERKEKQFGAQKPDTPWMQQPGMFGVDRQAAMMGGLGLLMGGY